MEILHGRQPLILLPERAAFCPVSRALFVADLHLGKSAVFRESGLAVPDGPDAAVLGRLSELVTTWKPAAVAILGDIFHAHGPHLAGTAEALDDCRRIACDAHWIIVPGNHDRRVSWARFLPKFSIMAEGDSLEPWKVSHFPPESSVSPVICGHLHPGIALGTARTRKVKSACFWERRGVLVLPAFGEFTGLEMITREPADRVWIPAGQRVAEVPAKKRA